MFCQTEKTAGGMIIWWGGEISLHTLPKKDIHAASQKSFSKPSSTTCFGASALSRKLISDASSVLQLMRVKLKLNVADGL